MKILVTGGVGFIGTNVCEHFAEKGAEIIILDDLSRKGTEKNLKFLKENIKGLKFIKGSVTNWKTVKKIFE